MNLKIIEKSVDKLVLFECFLKSKPGPSLEQLTELAVQGKEDVKPRALQAILEWDDLDLSVLTGVDCGSALLSRNLELFWSRFKTREKLNESEFYIIARYCERKHKKIALEVEAECRRRFGKLPSAIMRRFANEFKKSRKRYWQEMVELDWMHPNIATEFIRYPETKLLAGRWMLNYHRTYPHGRRMRRSKELSCLVADCPIDSDKLIPLLEIPVLRASAATALMKMDPSAHGIRESIRRAIKKNAPISEKKGLASVIRLLFKKARSDLYALLFLLDLPLSKRARKQASVQLTAELPEWLREWDLDSSSSKTELQNRLRVGGLAYAWSLRSALKKADPAYQKRLRRIVAQYRNEIALREKPQKQNATRRLFNQLLNS